MGTRWCKGSELGVVLATLGLAFGCGGKYAVGSGETGGAAGAGDAGEPGSGGSNVSGQGGSNQGGSSTGGGQSGGSGGTAGVAPGGASGASVGGASGASAGGSSTGGSGGGECDLPVEILPEYTIASPEALNDRLAIFLYGVRGARFEPLPEAADVSWVRSIVSRVLEEQFDEDGRAPEGLENFWLGWAFDHQGDANKAFWGSFFARGNFADLFRSVDGRVSFMSDPYFLRSHPDSTYRGTWMARYLFGFDVPPPPFEIERVTASSGKTRRQTVEEAVSGDACIGCHVHFDPLGFSLEHYDEYGDYRDVENGLTIDASGTYSQASVQLEFSSIDDLAGQLPALCEVQASFARAFFEHAILIAGFPADAYEPVELRYVTREFREGDLALAPLVLAAASTPAFLRAE